MAGVPLIPPPPPLDKPAKRRARGWNPWVIVLTVLLIVAAFGPEAYDRYRSNRVYEAAIERAYREPTGQGFKVPYRGSAVNRRIDPKDGLTYILVPAGSFEMGCSVGDRECYYDENPPRLQAFPQGFWMGQTAVTQWAYERMMGANPSHFLGADRPVDSVTWDEARSYCWQMGGRLPTEAEWEYAARGGTTGAYFGDLDQIAWYKANSAGKTHDVKQKAANGYGLYDMLGNVRQWTATWYKADQTRTVRGGSWSADAKNVRVSYRYGFVPERRSTSTGFRCIAKSTP